MEDRAGSSALVVFKSKQLWVASMHGMREIIQVPTVFQRSADTGGAVLGTMEWRGQAIAVVDLRKAFGAQRSVLTDETRVIVAEHGAGITAWLVEGVSGLIPAHAGTRSRFTTQGALVEMVTVGEGAEQQSYQLMDFNQALRSVSSSFSMA
jgi:chemotaxis signal transduction protein